MQFSPGIYEHAAALIGQSPWNVSRDPGLLAKAHHAAWERYRHPLIVAGIDVYNLEPEAFGAVILKPEGTNIPAISRHPCAEVEDLSTLPEFDPQNVPRITGTIAAGKLLKQQCPGAEVHIPMCGPFALAIGLVGLEELLMGLVEDRESVVCGLRHLLQGQMRFLDLIHSNGLHPVIFESGTTPPLLPVKSFIEVEQPLLAELFAYYRNLAGHGPHCIIGGDATPIAEPLFEVGPGYLIAPSETDQTAFMEIARRFPSTHVRVNMKGTLLLETAFLPIRKEADRVLRIASLRDNVSIGCGVVPFETNPETVLRLREYVNSLPTGE